MGAGMFLGFIFIAILVVGAIVFVKLIRRVNNRLGEPVDDENLKRGEEVLARSLKVNQSATREARQSENGARRMENEDDWKDFYSDRPGGPT